MFIVAVYYKLQNTIKNSNHPFVPVILDRLLFLYFLFIDYC